MVLVQHLMSTEEHRKLHLVTLFKELMGVGKFDIQIVLVGLGLGGTAVLGSRVTELLYLLLERESSECTRRSQNGCRRSFA